MGAPGEEKWTFKGRARAAPSSTSRTCGRGRRVPAGRRVEEEAAEGGHSVARGAATTPAVPTEAEDEAEVEAEAAGQETMVFTVDVGPSGATTKKPAEFTFKDGELKDKDDKVVEAIDVDLGTQFALLLEANPTTGYSWQLAGPLDESRLILVSKGYEQSKEEANKKEGEEGEGGETMVGVGGEEIWTFRAVGEGETEISLKYVRPWEASSPDDATITITVNIEKQAEEGK